MFSARDFVDARIFNSFSIPNVTSDHDRRIPGKCRRPDPNLRYRTRPITRRDKNKYCNICLPDAVVNRGGGSQCCPQPKTDINCNGSTSFTPTQNDCLCQYSCDHTAF